MTATVTPIRPDALTDEGEGLNAVELIRATGLTWQQVDWWTITGLLLPIPGHRYRYHPREAEVAKLGLALIEAGFSLRPALDHARRSVETGQPVILAGGLVTIIAEVAE